MFLNLNCGESIESNKEDVVISFEGEDKYNNALSNSSNRFNPCSLNSCYKNSLKYNILYG